MADGGDLEKRRRDLYAISLGIILYNTAQGSVSETATTLFGAVHLGRPWVLIVGAGIMWAYFLWQFLLAAKGQWSRIAKDVDRQIGRGRGFRRFTARRLQCIAQSAREKAEIYRSTNSSGHRVYTEYVRQVEEGIALKRCFARSADWLKTFDQDSLSDRSGNRTHLHLGIAEDDYKKYAEEQVPFAEWQRRRIVWAAALWSAIREDAFSDLLLPLIVAIGLTGVSLLVRLS
ncbi:hypothetical protein [Dokdonella sp.]|uniref:hypothetical protein n=1 Tax=Dokdonella sp. TaxID=2291710 RepID=UPI003783374B